MKTNILILCDFYLPSVKAGGPLRSISAIVDCLKNESDITIATRNHDLADSTPYQNILSNTLMQRDNFKIIYLPEKEIISGIHNLLTQYHFDIVYFNSFFSPKMTVLTLCYLKFKNINKMRIIISPRGELGNGALSIKRYRKKIFLFIFKKINYFRKIEFLAASLDEQNAMKAIFRKKNKVNMLPNVILQQHTDMISNHKIKNHIKIIFLSRISMKKNLDYALKVIATVKNTVEFDIYGLIENKQYWKICLDLIATLPKHIQVNYRGECDPDNVIAIMKHYDLFFVPTLNENFGYAIVESLAAGTPVLLSNQTPWHDLSENNAGWEFDLSKPEKFAHQIDTLSLLDYKI